MTAKIFRNAFLIGFTVLLACILLFFFIMYSNYQAQADRKERELAAGLCTETDLLQAQKNLLSAQTALQSTTDQANKALRQLAILLGKSGTSITLGEIPAVSATELASMNLDADRAAAVIASSSVKSARRSSATDRKSVV